MILTFLFLLSVLWRRLILKHNGTITNHLDVSSLSKVTDGYQALSKKPLTSVEFIAPLARIDPIYKEEEESFKVCISSSECYS